jgi:putative ABC transport system substrate-binding protein
MRLRGRDFTFLVGGTLASWPLATRAQKPAMPVIGALNSGSAAPFAELLAAFRRGLGEAGYVEGQNLAIEYRLAEGQYIACQAWLLIIHRRVAVLQQVVALCRSGSEKCNNDDSRSFCLRRRPGEDRLG